MDEGQCWRTSRTASHMNTLDSAALELCRIYHEMRPSLDSGDHSCQRRLFAEAGRLGLLGLRVNRPGSHFKPGLSSAMTVGAILAERGSLGLGSTLFILSNTVLPIIEASGNPELVRNYVDPALKGELIVSLAVTEPSGGSDLSNSIQTVATEVGSSFRITGTKTFITNAPIADGFLVLAKTLPDAGVLGMSFFIVDANRPGIKVRNLPKAGQRDSLIGEITFDSVLVDKSSLVGRLNEGFVIFGRGIEEERFLIGFASVLYAKGKLLEAVSALQAKFPEKRIPYQTVKHRIAAAITRLDAMAWYCRSVATRMDETGVVDRPALAISKILLPAAAQDALKVALQISGARSLDEGSSLQAAFIDSRIFQIYAGSTQTVLDLFSQKYLKRVI